MGEERPTVRFEPCHQWTGGPDAGSGVCAECGWLEEDHWVADLEREAVPV
jgi:hypothetical protein